VTGRPGISPWEVWDVDFSPQIGSEQAGIRPAIIVGSATMCDVAGRRLALVVPCTTRNRGLTWQPEIQLRQPSVAMCEQIKSVSRDRLIRRWPAPRRVPDDVRDQIRWTLQNLIG
jgi:mRNA interferase MazF